MSQTHALQLEQLRVFAVRDGGGLVSEPLEKSDQLPAGDNFVLE